MTASKQHKADNHPTQYCLPQFSGNKPGRTLNKENCYSKCFRFSPCMTDSGDWCLAVRFLRRTVLNTLFSRNISADEYGSWRIHAKILPDWMSQGHTILRTLRQPNSTEEKLTGTDDAQQDSATPTDAKKDDPILATAWLIFSLYLIHYWLILFDS